jgi:thymidylate kinase
MPSPLIIVEEPFGRKRQELKHLIDFVIYLDIEPEIALGRRIHDLIQYLRNDSEVIINLLDHFLFDYLYQGVKDMYIEIGKKVKVNSNLIINANRNIDDIVLEISELIRRKKGL